MKKLTVVQINFAAIVLQNNIGMKWNNIINGAPLGSGDISAGFAPHKKTIGVLGALGIGGMALSLGSSIFGGIQSSRARKEAERELARQKAENKAWYLRNYHMDYGDTSAGQNMMRIARDSARETWQQAAGAEAVAGGTPAATALAKEAGNKTVAEAAASIAAQDTARKANVDAAYRAERSRLAQQQMSLDQQRAENISRVAGGASDALAQGALLAAGTGSPGGGGVNPGTKTPSMEKLGVGEKLINNSSNYQILNPYIMQQLQGWGAA